MQDLNIINSIIEARYKTGKPAMSQKLEKQHERLIAYSGAREDAVDAPRSKLYYADANAVTGLVRLGLAYGSTAPRRGSKSVEPCRLKHP